MNLNEYLVLKFNKINTVFYNESIIELEIINLEEKLKQSTSSTEIDTIYKLINQKFTRLNNLKLKRFADFVLDELIKKPAQTDWL